MVKMFTLEVIAIAITTLVALTLFTYLILLVVIVSLLKLKRHFLIVVEECLELKGEHSVTEQVKQTISDSVARFAKTDNKIESIEDRLNNIENQISSFAGGAEKIASIEGQLDQLHQKITMNHDQLTGLASKLKEYDTQLGETSRRMGKQASVFNQTAQRIQHFEGKFQNLQAIQNAFEQLRNQILLVFGATQTNMPSQYTQRIKRETFNEDALFPPEEKQPETEGFH